MVFTGPLIEQEPAVKSDVVGEVRAPTTCHPTAARRADDKRAEAAGIAAKPKYRLPTKTELALIEMLQKLGCIVHGTEMRKRT